jgi:hypothetical protein
LLYVIIGCEVVFPSDVIASCFPSNSNKAKFSMEFCELIPQGLLKSTVWVIHLLVEFASERDMAVVKISESVEGNKELSPGRKCFALVDSSGELSASVFRYLM